MMSLYLLVLYVYAKLVSQSSLFEFTFKHSCEFMDFFLEVSLLFHSNFYATSTIIRPAVSALLYFKCTSMQTVWNNWNFQ